MQENTISPYTSQHYILNFVNSKWYFFIGMKCFFIIGMVARCFIIISIFISLLTSTIEHLCICLLFLEFPPPWIHFSHILPTFPLDGLSIFFSYWYRSALYIIDFFILWTLIMATSGVPLTLQFSWMAPLPACRTQAVQPRLAALTFHSWWLM